MAKPEAQIGTAAVADPKAREFLLKADPVMARLIEAHPDFRPRAWMDELPLLDAFGTVVFQVGGQQLSVAATRKILSRVVANFGGRLPSPAELLAVDAQVLRDSGMSARKGATLRAIAERFVDGRLSDEVLAGMSDDEVEAALTEVPGVGPWTAHGFLLIALDRPDVFFPGDLALRRDRAGVRLRPRTNRTGAVPRARVPDEGNEYRSPPEPGCDDHELPIARPPAKARRTAA